MPVCVNCHSLKGSKSLWKVGRGKWITIFSWMAHQVVCIHWRLTYLTVLQLFLHGIGNLCCTVIVEVVLHSVLRLHILPSIVASPRVCATAADLLEMVVLVHAGPPIHPRRKIKAKSMPWCEEAVACLPKIMQYAPDTLPGKNHESALSDVHFQLHCIVQFVPIRLW